MSLTIELPQEQHAALAAKAEAEGVSAEEYVRQVLAHHLEPPIWERIVENMKRVPPEDLAALPQDGASQIDHYVYGAPKRQL